MRLSYNLNRLLDELDTLCLQHAEVGFGGYSRVVEVWGPVFRAEICFETNIATIEDRAGNLERISEFDPEYIHVSGGSIFLSPSATAIKLI